MPLPENDTPWPPPEMATALASMATDDAWYSGDRDRIRRAHQPSAERATETGRRLRFWERPRRLDTPDYSLHIPLPGDIATTSADLLFSEPPTLTVDGTETQARLDELAEAGGLANTLLEAGEVAAALRGAYLRVTWHQDLAKRTLLTTHHADTAVPEWTSGFLTAVTFWREVSADGVHVRRHLERHEPGRILHALYEGTKTNLGRAVPLTEDPATADLVDSLDAGGDGQTITTGIDRLTAGYVKNMGPDRRDRRSPLGRSDFQGVDHLFHALDEVWTSWMRDIRLARARLIVPSGYLTNDGPGQGASFDLDREVWSAINASPTSGEGITENQFLIRVDEHQRTAEAIVRQAVKLAGYSAQSFGMDGETAVTATEVVARERKSMITRDKKSRYWGPVLADMLEVLLMMDARLGFSNVTPERPKIEFGDSVSEDPKSVAETLSLLAQAQAVSTETKVRILRPDWDDTAVREETDRILKETGQAVNDPSMTGAEGPGAPGFGRQSGGEQPKGA
ncbi:phage portal protein [Streptomyces wuyuanensis]|uniref:Phage portal protein, putative, A118 family n=1 Tax=Streptomyces wuyuanensis TaxID=1196353 RepID=A0A1G9VYD7_9ACTN|nr:phage capsid protein [Streptomyces wuyuanensis]SDM77153.1 phage portal protein, putative, A118 family [Streptomyces wuyuanensis]